MKVMGQARIDKGNKTDEEINWSNVMDEIILNLYPKVEDNMVEDVSYWCHEYGIVVSWCEDLHGKFLEMKAAFGKFCT